MSLNYTSIHDVMYLQTKINVITSTYFLYGRNINSEPSVNLDSNNPIKTAPIKLKQCLVFGYSFLFLHVIMQ